LGENLNVAGSENGFIWSACRAYNDGIPLTIRPDDVWLAIIQQISFYRSRNRDKTLEEDDFDIPTMMVQDFENPRVLAEEMIYFVTRNCLSVRRKNLLMSGSVMTRPEDITAAAVLLLGTAHKETQRDLRFGNGGIPTVSLAGQYVDWLIMLDKLSGFRGESKEVQLFIDNIRPILQRLYYAAQNPHDPKYSEFLRTVVRKTPPDGKDDKLVTGWIAAFCHFDCEGQVRRPDKERSGQDGMSYKPISLDDIPPGTASMPIRLINGNKIENCTLMGGSLYTSSVLSEQDEWVYAPLKGWILCLDGNTEMARRRGEILDAVRREIWRERGKAVEEIDGCAWSSSAVMLSLSRIEERLEKL
jgi:hypothetical protein